MARWLGTLLGVWLAAGQAWPALAQDDALAIGLGAFSIDESDTAAEIRLEYHSAFRLFEGSLWDGFDGFAPIIGFMANSDDAVFGYAGVQVDIELDDHWVATPAFGVGGYDEGNSRDLGGVFQFHLGATLAYRVADGHRLGLTWAHISNAGIHEDNPAADSLLLTYRARLDALF